MGWLRDETGLEKTAANYAPLTPLSHLTRARDLFGDQPAVVYGKQHRKTYVEYHARVSCLASALARLGVTPGDVVATILPNLPAQVEAHFGVPAAGAVLNAINTRLDVGTVSYILGPWRGPKSYWSIPKFPPLPGGGHRGPWTGPHPKILESPPTLVPGVPPPAGGPPPKKEEPAWPKGRTPF